MKKILTHISQLPLPLLRGFALAVAGIINLAPFTGLRKMVHINLLLAYPHLPHKQRNQLEKQAVKNQCLAVVEAVKSWGEPPAYSIAQITQVTGQPQLADAMANPNGMIAIVPHLGTWEMMNAWLNQFGAPTIMYKPSRNTNVDAFILQGRQRLNATLVPTDSTGVKAIFKQLKQGGFTILLPDHVPADSAGGVYAPFFGINTLSSTLVSKLASKTGCALVLLSCIRREDGNGFKVNCKTLTTPQLWSKNTQHATAALNQAMQDFIEPITEHYMWGYRRFKNSAGIDGLYNDKSDQDIVDFATNTQ